MRVERFFRAPLFAPPSKYAASYVRACVGRNQSDRLSGTREIDRRIRPRFRPPREREHCFLYERTRICAGVRAHFDGRAPRR